MPRLTTAELEEHERQKSRPGSPQKRRTASTPKEREIQKAILAFLATVPGVVAWKTGGGMFRLSYKGKERVVRMGVRGISDIVGWRSAVYSYDCTNGKCEWRAIKDPHSHGEMVPRFLAIEVKRPGHYPTPEQQAFLDQVKAAGGLAVTARSVHDVALALGLAVRGSTPGGARGEER